MLPFLIAVILSIGTGCDRKETASSVEADTTPPAIPTPLANQPADTAPSAAEMERTTAVPIPLRDPKDQFKAERRKAQAGAVQPLQQSGTGVELQQRKKTEKLLEMERKQMRKKKRLEETAPESASESSS